MNKRQLNYKRVIGPINELIRKSGATTSEEWMRWYAEHVKSEAELRQLGAKIWEYLNTVVREELDSITPEDAVEYYLDFIGNKSFGGHSHENATWAWLETQTGIVFIAASDEWDRLFGVDGYAALPGGVVAVQVKPESFFSGRDHHEWQRQLDVSNARFAAQHGGRVFVVVYNEDEIINPEIVDDIRAQISKWK